MLSFIFQNDAKRILRREYNILIASINIENIDIDIHKKNIYVY